VLLTGPLIILGGCAETSTYPYKGVEVETSVVVIKDCVATPDLVKVKNNTPVHWEVDRNDQATYIVAFSSGDHPIQGSTAVVSVSLPDLPHTVKGGTGCSSVLPWLCGTYPYTLTQVLPNKSTVCKDPGVHVGPG
jgi:hypothetical protein